MSKISKGGHQACQGLAEAQHSTTPPVCRLCQPCEVLFLPRLTKAACHGANEAPAGSSSAEDKPPDLSPALFLASPAHWEVFSLAKITSMEELCAHQRKIRQDLISVLGPAVQSPFNKGEKRN